MKDDTDNKSRRLVARVSPSHYDIVELAAKVSDQSMSNLIAQATLDAAHKLIKRHTMMQIAGKQYLRVLADQLKADSSPDAAEAERLDKLGTQQGWRVWALTGDHRGSVEGALGEAIDAALAPRNGLLRHDATVGYTMTMVDADSRPIGLYRLEPVTLHVPETEGEGADTLDLEHSEHLGSWKDCWRLSTIFMESGLEGGDAHQWLLYKALGHAGIVMVSKSQNTDIGLTISTQDAEEGALIFKMLPSAIAEYADTQIENRLWVSRKVCFDIARSMGFTIAENISPRSLQ